MGNSEGEEVIETAVDVKIFGTDGCKDAKVVVMGSIDDHGYMHSLSLFISEDGARHGQSIQIGKKQATVLALSMLEMAKK